MKGSKLDAYTSQIIFVNSPVYWKGKLFSVQTIGSREKFPSLFNTIKLDACSRSFGSLGLYISNCRGVRFSPGGYKPRVLDLPDITGCVYDQFAKLLHERYDEPFRRLFLEEVHRNSWKAQNSKPEPPLNIIFILT